MTDTKTAPLETLLQPPTVTIPLTLPAKVDDWQRLPALTVDEFEKAANGLRIWVRDRNPEYNFSVESFTAFMIKEDYLLSRRGEHSPAVDIVRAVRSLAICVALWHRVQRKIVGADYLSNPGQPTKDVRNHMNTFMSEIQSVFRDKSVTWAIDCFAMTRAMDLLLAFDREMDRFFQCSNPHILLSLPDLLLQLFDIYNLLKLALLMHRDMPKPLPLATLPEGVKIQEDRGELVLHAETKGDNKNQVPGGAAAAADLDAWLKTEESKAAPEMQSSESTDSTTTHTGDSVPESSNNQGVMARFRKMWSNSYEPQTTGILGLSAKDCRDTYDTQLYQPLPTAISTASANDAKSADTETEVMKEVD